MAGARCLDMRKLKGKLLLTLDSHALLSSGAGEMDADLTLPMRKELLSGDADGVRLCVSGLRGGHSGANAMDEPGNAIMLLARTLRQLEKTTAFSLADLFRRHADQLRLCAAGLGRPGDPARTAAECCGSRGKNAGTV